MLVLVYYCIYQTRSKMSNKMLGKPNNILLFREFRILINTACMCGYRSRKLSYLNKREKDKSRPSRYPWK